MKIDDITEHEVFEPRQGFTWLTPELATGIKKEGERLPAPLTMSYGSFPVWIRKMYMREQFLVLDTNDTPLAFAEVEQNPLDKEYWFLRRLERNKQKHTVDMAAALFFYVGCDLKRILLSDKTMTKDGETFWLKMAERAQMHIGIIDIFTGKLYDKSFVSKSLSDGTLLLDPRNDKKADTLVDGTKRPRAEYRFYWAAIPDSQSHLYTEMMEERAIYDQADWFFFGEQNYPDYE